MLPFVKRAFSFLREMFSNRFYDKIDVNSSLAEKRKTAIFLSFFPSACLKVTEKTVYVHILDCQIINLIENVLAYNFQFTLPTFLPFPTSVLYTWNIQPTFNNKLKCTRHVYIYVISGFRYFDGSEIHFTPLLRGFVEVYKWE